ncbi:hypothetical protein GCM10010321_88280 [Streptomyces chartreusis]|nr:hypothetical protein GCM10010321_88280 [Streptomyces chartreusis]
MGGPAVEGEWTVPSTARDRYMEWVGLYGTGSTVVIRRDHCPHQRRGQHPVAGQPRGFPARGDMTVGGTACTPASVTLVPLKSGDRDAR